MPPPLGHTVTVLLTLLALLDHVVVGLGDFRVIDVLNRPAEEAFAKLVRFSRGELRGSHGKHHRHKDTEDVQELYFAQRLDHFRSDSRTFRQRYFYSDRFVSNATQTLALLCVGGEGPALDRSVLVDSVHCTGDMLEFVHTIHEEYSIHLFALEHRYYGESYPDFGPFRSASSNAYLVYLSSRQAVADISHFVSYQRRFKLGASRADPFWITFGGSYPGMLAAWARLKMPHQIHAAVSSSAPVQPALDFRSYNAHVAHEWADPVIGGSPDCVNVIQQGHEELVEAALNVSRHEEIASAFGLCDATSLRNKLNLQLLVGDGVLPRHMQGNDPSCDGPFCNVQKICDTVLTQVGENNTTNLGALIWLAQQTYLKNATCVNLSWTETLRYLSDPVRGKEDRSWLWQTCAEFGFFQTCEVNSTCPFGRGWHPLEEDLAICQQAFGVEPRQVAWNIQDTLEYYGGWKMAGTRILSITGSVDPWSELALQKSANTKDRPVYHVPGASHHFWTHPVKETDGKEIQQAREIIFTTLRSWLPQQTSEERLEGFVAMG